MCAENLKNNVDFGNILLCEAFNVKDLNLDLMRAKGTSWGKR